MIFFYVFIPPLPSMPSTNMIGSIGCQQSPQPLPNLTSDPTIKLLTYLIKQLPRAFIRWNLWFVVLGENISTWLKNQDRASIWLRNLSDKIPKCQVHPNVHQASHQKSRILVSPNLSDVSANKCFQVHLFTKVKKVWLNISDQKFGETFIWQ